MENSKYKPLHFAHFQLMVDYPIRCCASQQLVSLKKSSFSGSKINQIFFIYLFNYLFSFAKKIYLIFTFALDRKKENKTKC